MDLRRVRAWDWLAGTAGAVLIASLFVPWYKAGGRTLTAWQAFTVNDVIFLIAGLFGIAIAAAAASQRTGAIPQTISSLSGLPAVVAAVLAVYRTLSPPDSGQTREAGLWIGLGAVLVLVVACLNAMSDQRQPRAPKPHVETIPAPRPE